MSDADTDEWPSLEGCPEGRASYTPGASFLPPAGISLALAREVEDALRSALSSQGADDDLVAAMDAVVAADAGGAAARGTCLDADRDAAVAVAADTAAGVGRHAVARVDSCREAEAEFSAAADILPEGPWSGGSAPPDECAQVRPSVTGADAWRHLFGGDDASALAPPEGVAGPSDVALWGLPADPHAHGHGASPDAHPSDGLPQLQPASPVHLLPAAIAAEAADALARLAPLYAASEPPSQALCVVQAAQPSGCEGVDGGAGAAAAPPPGALALPELGPCIVNSDGTVSSIANWAELSERERAIALRRIAKRNEARRAALSGGDAVKPE